MGPFENMCNAQIDFIAFLWLDFFFEVKCGCWSTNIYYFSTFDFARIDKKVFALRRIFNAMWFSASPDILKCIKQRFSHPKNMRWFIFSLSNKINISTNTTVDCKFSLFINTHQTGEMNWIFKLRTTFSSTFFNYVQNSPSFQMQISSNWKRCL